MPLRYLVPIALSVIGLGWYMFAVYEYSPSMTDSVRADRLPAYVEQVRLDPLFGLPGTDLEKYDRSVAELVRSRDELAATYSTAEAAIITQNMYPVEFLYSLGALETLRRELIAAPTTALARKYHEQLLVVVMAHRDYVSTVSQQLHEHTALFQDQMIGFYGSVSSVSHVRAVYEEVLKQNEQQLAQALSRYECLTTEDAHCEAIAAPVVPIRAGLTHSDVTIVPADISDHLALFEHLAEVGYRGTTSAKVAVLADSACVQSYQPAYYLMRSRVGNDATTVFTPEILNEVVFYDLPVRAADLWKYAEVFLERDGGQYLLQPTLSHYMCPDVATDLSRLQSLQAIANFTPEINYTGTDEVLKQAIVDFGIAQATLRDASLVTEQATFEVLEAAVAMLQATAASSDPLAEETVRTLEELLLITQLGTYAFDELIMNVVHNNDVVTKYAYHGSPTFLGEVLYLRSAPTMLLLGFNPSVTPQSPTYIQSKTSLPHDRFTTYQEVRESYSVSELLTMLGVNVILEIQLGREAGLDFVTQ